MKKPYLVAREREIAFLENADKSSKSEFLAVFGRRRVGKTYLIHEYFSGRKQFFEFTGTRNLPKKEQIRNFLAALEKSFHVTFDSIPNQWPEAFSLLLKTLDEHADAHAKKSKEKTVLFFDELPWLATKKSGFLEALDYLWNATLSKRRDILLIVCGSAANWMISEILNHKGGFHNRVTRPPLEVAPFTVKETQEYLLAHDIHLNHESIAEIYMVTGGVAYYLDQVARGESAALFINKHFFSEHGELRSEFDRLFRSLFDHYQSHVSVVRLLAKHPSGLSYPELSKLLKIPTGGSFTQMLNELEKSHFIRFTPKMGNKKRGGVYHLIDEYTLFYLTWVEPLGRTFKDPSYWQKQLGKPKYHNWLGHAFEALCFKEVESIKSILGINGLTTNVYGFRTQKAQIDLIIDRSDKTMNLCEMKYTYSPFSMTAQEAQKIKNRKTELQAQLKRKKQIFVTLITAFPAKKNQHYLSVVDQEISLKNFFRS